MREDLPYYISKWRNNLFYPVRCIGNIAATKKAGLKSLQYHNQKWMKEIRHCQLEIAANEPHPYYLSAYREEEAQYWLHIPQWITQLSTSGFKVNRVLDIGCGFGTLALFCRRTFDCEVYCTDVNVGYLSPSLQNKHGLDFIVNNIELDDIPWPVTFDVIVLSEVIEHFNYYPVPTLQKIRKLLTPHGKIFISSPDAKEWGRITQYYSRLEDLPQPGQLKQFVDDHIWQYTKEELFKTIEDSGLKIDKLKYSPGMAKRHFNLQLSIDEST